VILVQRGKNYVVYDKDEKVIIITREKNIAVQYARSQYVGVR